MPARHRPQQPSILLAFAFALHAPSAFADLASVVPPSKFKPIDEAYTLATGPSVELEAQEFDLAGGVAVASCPAGVWTGSAKYYGHEGGEFAYTGMFWRCFPYGQGMARFADGSAHQGLFTSYVLGKAPKLIDAKNARLAVREGPGNALSPAGQVTAGVFARGVAVAADDPRAVLVPNLIAELQTRAQVAVGPPPPLFADGGRSSGAISGMFAATPPPAAAPVAPGGAPAPSGGGWLGSLGKLATGDIQGALKDQVQQKAADALGLGDLNKAVTDFNNGNAPGAVPGVAGMFGVPQVPQLPQPQGAPAPNAGLLGGLAGGLGGNLGGGGVPNIGGMFKGSAEKALKDMAQQKLADSLGVGNLNAAIAGSKLEDPAVLAALLNGGNVTQGDLQAIALLRDPTANDAQKAQALKMLLGGGAGSAAATPGGGLATPPQIADLSVASPLAAYSASPQTGTPAENAAASMPVSGVAPGANTPGSVGIAPYRKPATTPYAPGTQQCVMDKNPGYNQAQRDNVARRLVPFAWKLDLPQAREGVSSLTVVSPADLYFPEGKKPDLRGEFEWLVGDYWESPGSARPGSVITLLRDGTGFFQYAAFHHDARDRKFAVQWFLVTDACGVMMGGTHPSYGSEIFQVLLVTLDGQHDFGEGRAWTADWVHLHAKPANLGGQPPRAVFMSRIQPLQDARLPRTFPR